jgi:hypothetical protein
MQETGVSLRCESFLDWKSKIGASNALNPLSFYFDRGFPRSQAVLSDITMEAVANTVKVPENYLSILCKKVSQF